MKYYYLNIPEGVFKYALYAITKNLQNFKQLQTATSFVSINKQIFVPINYTVHKECNIYFDPVMCALESTKEILFLMFRFMELPVFVNPSEKFITMINPNILARFIQDCLSQYQIDEICTIISEYLFPFPEECFEVIELTGEE